MHLMAMYGGLSRGSYLWGTVAQHTALPVAILLSGLMWFAAGLLGPWKTQLSNWE